MKICEHFTNVEQDCFCKMKQKVLGTIESYDGEECGKCELFKEDKSNA